jgi:hypothetical protein
MNICNFLVANTHIDDSGDALETRVKRLILHIAGDFDNSAKDLPDNTDFVKDLSFRHNEFIFLRKHLEKLLKEYDQTARITAVNVGNCKLVGDCLDLVKLKIK